MTFDREQVYIQTHTVAALVNGKLRFWNAGYLKISFLQIIL